MVKSEDESVLIKRIHMVTGHGGRDVCYEFIKNNFGVRVPKNNILKVIGKCSVCSFFFSEGKFKQGNSPVFGLFERIGVDCVGLLPKSYGGKLYHYGHRLCHWLRGRSGFEK